MYGRETHPEDVDFENGTSVVAMGSDGEMHDGVVTTHTCDMDGITDGFIVRLDDGGYEEYDYSTSYLVQAR
jgi:hypothetical protein